MQRTKSISAINKEISALQSLKAKKKKKLWKGLAVDVAEVAGATWAAGQAFGIEPEIAAPIFATILGSAEAYEHRKGIKKKLKELL